MAQPVNYSRINRQAKTVHGDCASLPLDRVSVLNRPRLELGWAEADAGMLQTGWCDPTATACQLPVGPLNSRNLEKGTDLSSPGQLARQSSMHVATVPAESSNPRSRWPASCPAGRVRGQRFWESRPGFDGCSYPLWESPMSAEEGTGLIGSAFRGHQSAPAPPAYSSVGPLRDTHWTGELSRQPPTVDALTAIPRRVPECCCPTIVRTRPHHRHHPPSWIHTVGLDRRQKRLRRGGAPRTAAQRKLQADRSLQLPASPTIFAHIR